MIFVLTNLKLVSSGIPSGIGNVNIYPVGKTSTNVEIRPNLAPYERFPNVLILRGRRKEVALTSSTNLTYE